MCLPDFIESVKQAEDQALEKQEVEEAKDIINDIPTDPILTEVFGKYKLEDTYDLSHFQQTQNSEGQIINGKFSQNCKIFKCQEQDDMGDLDPATTYYDRYIVLTKTCLLVFAPLKQFQYHA